jgi:hypothetical protein
LLEWLGLCWYFLIKKDIRLGEEFDGFRSNSVMLHVELKGGMTKLKDGKNQYFGARWVRDSMKEAMKRKANGDKIRRLCYRCQQKRDLQKENSGR